MKKNLFYLAIGAVLISLAAVTGCNIVASTTATTIGTGTATPPSGTTGISVGSAGTATGTIGSSTGVVYTFVIDSTTSTALTNLLLGNLKIFIAGPTITGSVECTVSTATISNSTSGSPVSIAMSLDRSGSMGSTSNADLETAAKSFVSNMGSSDQGAIINFGALVVTDQTLTSNKTSLNNAIDNPSYSDSGGTALFDSIGTAVTTLDAAATGNRKAVISMTDGGENSSSTYTTTAAVIAHANSKSVPVYTVGLGSLSGTSLTNLQDIATGTGGVYYAAPTSSDLLSLYNKISSALSNFYTITFTLPSGTVFTSGAYTITFQVVSYGTLTGSTSITLTL